MKVVLDTNVVLSGIFFGGLPLKILDACIVGAFDLVVSPEIWAEYEATAQDLALRHPSPLMPQMLHLLASSALMVKAPPLPAPLCRDPNDDMFIACCLAASAFCVVSGDKDLHAVTRIPDFLVLTPRQFLARLA